MLEDRVIQDRQQNIRQDNIAYNRRPYDDQQVMSPNRPEEDAPMVKMNKEDPRSYQQNTLIQQVVNFEYDPELRHLVQGNDASIEQIIKEIMHVVDATKYRRHSLCKPIFLKVALVSSQLSTRVYLLRRSD